MTAVQHNADLTKDLKPGSLVAVNHPDWVGTVPQIATVVKIPDDLTETPEVDIAWMDHERSSKKATWLQSFRESKLPYSTISLDNFCTILN